MPQDRENKQLKRKLVLAYIVIAILAAIAILLYIKADDKQHKLYAIEHNCTWQSVYNDPLVEVCK